MSDESLYYELVVSELLLYDKEEFRMFCDTQLGRGVVEISSALNLVEKIVP